MLRKNIIGIAVVVLALIFTVGVSAQKDNKKGGRKTDERAPVSTERSEQNTNTPTNVKDARQHVPGNSGGTTSKGRTKAPAADPAGTTRPGNVPSRQIFDVSTGEIVWIEEVRPANPTSGNSQKTKKPTRAKVRTATNSGDTMTREVGHKQKSKSRSGSVQPKSMNTPPRSEYNPKEIGVDKSGVTPAAPATPGSTDKGKKPAKTKGRKRGRNGRN